MCIRDRVVADLQGDLLDGRRQQGESGHELGVPVALHDLGLSLIHISEPTRPY